MKKSTTIDPIKKAKEFNQYHGASISNFKKACDIVKQIFENCRKPQIEIFKKTIIPLSEEILKDMILISKNKIIPEILFFPCHATNELKKLNIKEQKELFQKPLKIYKPEKTNNHYYINKSVRKLTLDETRQFFSDGKIRLLKEQKEFNKDIKIRVKEVKKTFRKPKEKNIKINKEIKLNIDKDGGLIIKCDCGLTTKISFEKFDSLHKEAIVKMFNKQKRKSA